MGIPKTKAALHLLAYSMGFNSVYSNPYESLKETTYLAPASSKAGSTTNKHINTKPYEKASRKAKKYRS